MRFRPAIVSWLVIAIGWAQQAERDSSIVIRSSTREVLLEIVVRDSHGRLVVNLDSSQVAVFENGVKQDIRSFRLVKGSDVRAAKAQQQQQAVLAEPVPEPETQPTPRLVISPLRTVSTVCLVLADLTPETRARAYEAARKFVDKELRPDTFISIFTMDQTGLRPVFPFSNNRENLLKAVELAASKQLGPLHQDTATLLNALNLTTGAQPTGFGNLANQTTLNGLAIDPSGAPVVPGVSAYGTSDGASVQDPLGTRADMSLATQAGLREISALRKLVQQLSSLPFQKAVLLMSGGLTRPPDQLEYWNSLIRSANKGGVTFYGLDIYGLGVCQDTSGSPNSNSKDDCATSTTAAAASNALTQQAAAYSQQQSTVARDAEKTVPRAGGVGVDYVPSGTSNLMESMHQSDIARFGVLSANTQEALRELAESTGGFLIANANNSDLLSRVMDDVDTHYELSYRPATDLEDGHYRKIEVKLAAADLRTETRGGYFAVPDTDVDPLTPADIAGLRALESKPLPHAFDFHSRAFRFRHEDGFSQYSIAFQIPISNLKATAEPAQKKQRFHASLLALAKNEKGEIMDRFVRDVASEVPDAAVAALRSDYMTYAHTVSLPRGTYTIETAVVDQEDNRASTNVFSIENPEQDGLQVSDLALVHIVQSLKRAPDPSDPFEVPGRHASPFASSVLPAGADPYIYFVIYPEQNSATAPTLQAQFLKQGQVLAAQEVPLPLPNESGAIPMAIKTIREPGDYEVKISVGQGKDVQERSLKYSVAAK